VSKTKVLARSVGSAEKDSCREKSQGKKIKLQLRIKLRDAIKTKFMSIGT
jgi:hypothetical protein